MKKPLAAIAILACLGGGTWLVYGALSSSSETSSQTAKTSSPKLKPFESESLGASNSSKNDNAPETNQRAPEPTKTASANSTESTANGAGSKKTGADRVETEAVVLGVEQSGDSEPSSKNETDESSPPSNVHDNLGDLVEDKNEEKKSKPELRLSKQQRKALKRTIESQQLDLKKLSNGNLPAADLPNLNK